MRMSLYSGPDLPGKRARRKSFPESHVRMALDLGEAPVRFQTIAAQLQFVSPCTAIF
jgi:hypothetical protein